MDESWFQADPHRMPLDKLLASTGQALNRFYQRTVAAHGLTPTSIGVLGALARADAVSHRDLAAQLGVTPATLTPVVDSLQSGGELTRERDAGDRRVVRLSITPAGEARLAAAFEQVAMTFRERIPAPTAGDAEIVRSYLLAMLAAVEGE